MVRVAPGELEPRRAGALTCTRARVRARTRAGARFISRVFRSVSSKKCLGYVWGSGMKPIES